MVSICGTQSYLASSLGHTPPNASWIPLQMQYRVKQCTCPNVHRHPKLIMQTLATESDFMCPKRDNLCISGNRGDCQALAVDRYPTLFWNTEPPLAIFVEIEATIIQGTTNGEQRLAMRINTTNTSWHKGEWRLSMCTLFNPWTDNDRVCHSTISSQLTNSIPCWM